MQSQSTATYPVTHSTQVLKFKAYTTLQFGMGSTQILPSEVINLSDEQIPQASGNSFK